MALQLISLTDWVGMSFFEDHYFAFEQKFRGPEALIRQRLTFYTNLLSDAGFSFQDKRVLDLGPGRGEWLGLTTDLGATSLGVDLNQRMVDRCVEKGLDVVCDDAFRFLNQSAQKFDVISAFHLIEHLDFETWSNLISLAYEKLEDGGLLILETPNPENLSVGSMSFYIDPTHVRPIPAPLLGFALETAGFNLVKGFRLNSGDQLVTRFQALSGFGPDLGFISQKAVQAVGLEFPTRPESELSYEYWIEQQAKSEAANIEARLRSELRNVVERTAEVLASTDEEIAKLSNEVREQSLRHQRALDEIKHSLSWRITKPLRAFGSMFRKN